MLYKCLKELKIKLLVFLLKLLVTVSFNGASYAVTYPLATNGSRLVGKNKVVLVPKGNTKPLEYFAAKYQIGLSNMIEANPGVDPYLPKGGVTLNIPHQLILPKTMHDGIIINSAEMRLYYYPRNSKTVIVLPIGIGRIGSETPTSWVTKIENKRAFPTWKPTNKIYAEYALSGKLLPEIVPYGPDNPMGLYVLYIGNLYAIHGTNSNFGIGLRVTHGCVRMRNEDIKFLFRIVPIGTRVQFINEPIKATIEPNGIRYIEVHNPLSTRKEQIDNNLIVPISLDSAIVSIINNFDVNITSLQKALRDRSGMPVRLN